MKLFVKRRLCSSKYRIQLTEPHSLDSHGTPEHFFPFMLDAYGHMSQSDAVTYRAHGTLSYFCYFYYYFHSFQRITNNNRNRDRNVKITIDHMQYSCSVFMCFTTDNSIARFYSKCVCVCETVFKLTRESRCNQ